MAGAQLGTAVRQIEQLFAEGTSTGLSDTHLLNRFATPVRGGLIGAAPDLANLDDGDLRFNVDFRDIYVTLLRRWLDIDPVPILGRRSEDLAIF